MEIMSDSLNGEVKADSGSVTGAGPKALAGIDSLLGDDLADVKISKAKNPRIWPRESVLYEPLSIIRTSVSRIWEVTLFHGPMRGSVILGGGESRRLMRLRFSSRTRDVWPHRRD
jgi:hypothetical protein